jgi:hypothetical protein
MSTGTVERTGGVRTRLIIGFLAAAIGLGGAVAFGVFGYVLAICASAALPETHGRQFAAAE